MKTDIISIDIDNEMDIVLAHRRAMQITKFAGCNISDQTRFATAVSEICRNVLDFCKNGNIVFYISDINNAERNVIEAVISDCGPGIKELDVILKRNPQTHIAKGRGIVFSKKLVDHFQITSNSKGTKVTLGVNIPITAKPVSKVVVQGWINHIKNEPAVTAYEELKLRNANLLQLTEELRLEKLNTEKKIAEIHDLNEQLAKTNSYLEEFTYTVSHDLRTPLTNLKLSLGFLEEESDPKSMLEYVEIIRRAAKRLEKTVMGLVEILDVQTKNRNLTKKIQLEDFFNDIKSEFGEYLAKGITIDHDFMIDEINYVEPYLNSIFTNLISNSIKYRVTGRPLKINIKNRRANGMVMFSFADNAEGIDMTKHGKRIFSPFTRFNDSQEGKGIGLYIIKKMIEHHNGRIEVHSEKGTGTTFNVFLKELPNAN